MCPLFEKTGGSTLMRHTTTQIHIFRRVTSLILSLSLIFCPFAFASEAMGWPLHTAHRPLSDGAALTTNWFWSDTYSDLRTERCVTYRPNQNVKPSVSYGSTVLTKSTLETMARALENSGRRVVGGTNGDFFVLATGTPLGMVVTDGVLRSSSSYHYAIGFRADGTAFVGQPSLKISANLPDGAMTISGGVNKIRGEAIDVDGAVLLTSDFSDSTQNTTVGVDVFLTPLSDHLGSAIPAAQTPVGEDLTVSQALTIGGRVRCRVDTVVETDTASAIPAGGFILTVNAVSYPELADRLRSLRIGQEISIDIASADRRWNEATEALGGMFRLLENGSLGPGLKDNGGSQQTARTAIGVREDGSILFYTMDGKQPGVSVGATCTQVALRLLELGCVDAIGLDGGGSTTLGITCPEANTMEVVNSPSDGAQRAVSNAVFLTTELQPTGTPGGLMLTPGNAVLLRGMRLDFSAHTLDTHWYDMGEATDVTYTAAGTGSIMPDGHFIAEEPGETVVTGTLGGMTGSSNITVVDTPATLSITEEATGNWISSLTLPVGESVNLHANATWYGFSLPEQDDAYLWTCDPALGTFAADGTFTAGAAAGTGEIVVLAGERRVVIPLTVVTNQPHFADMADHWAFDYAERLYDLGIANGVSQGDVLLYLPENQITRAEFFTMIARWLRLDLSAYADTILPFADTECIPDWALNAIQAMYAEGFVAGREEAAGLYACPDSQVTRAEALTILGRTQEFTGAQDDLNRFSDAADVPDWAEAYMKNLVGLGVIDGYDDGTIRPGDPMSRAQVAKVLYTLS